MGVTVKRFSWVLAAFLAACPSEEPSPEPNLAPTEPGVQLFPAEPVAADWIDAVILGPAVDPEGGEVTYRYRWYRDDEHAAFLDDLESVWPEETASGQTWRVEVTAVDREGAQGPAGTASAAVRGSPPSIAGAALGPPGATVEDTLVADGLNWEDADGDDPSYTFEWWVDGRRAESTASTLEPEAFGEGNSVFVVVTPVDGEFTGQGVDSNTLVIRPVDPCGALSFDGVDDRVTVGGDALPAAADFAFEVWIRSDGPGVVASTRAAGAGWELAVDGSGVVSLWSAGDVLTAESTLPDDDALHHVAVNRNNADGAAGVFIDGTAVASGTVASPGIGGGLVFGDAPTGGAAWAGVMDDARLSVVPRFRDGFSPELYWPADVETVASWHWSEGAGDTSADQAGVRDAALDGAAWTDGVSACSR